MSDQNMDVVVIGAGPGGYVAAIRCAQLGLKTACIDAWTRDGKASPGGTCLNVGCIPSKALIESSELFEKTSHEMAEHGINIKEAVLDLKKMIARKEQVVNDLTSGVAALFQANKISFFHGKAFIENANTVKVSSADGKDSSIQCKYIIIATGSTPTELKGVEFDHKLIHDSTGALAFSSVPKKLAIIGAGVIALELGSVWRRLGAEVTLFKTRPGLLPEADQAIAREAEKQFMQQGLKFNMGVKIDHAKPSARKVTLNYSKEDKVQSEDFDKIVVAIGRRPCSQGLFDDSLGVKINEKGFVEVDKHCRTAVANIFAIGDVVRGPMLAHKASEEGVMAAEIIAGHSAWVELDTVPAVIYTAPEIAWVGKTEQQCKQENLSVNIGQFPFSANGRARAIGEHEGFVKIIADSQTDRILGVHIIGPQASEMIAQAKIAMEFKAASEDLALTMFAHPTLSEALHEAALSVDGRAIHAVQRKKR